VGRRREVGVGVEGGREGGGRGFEGNDEGKGVGEGKRRVNECWNIG